jgi:hypothetical protein
MGDLSGLSAYDATSGAKLWTRSFDVSGLV